MYITGLGTIGAFGRGKNCFVSEAEKYINTPLSYNANYKVNENDLKDKAINRKLRRADRFTKIAVISAYDSIKDNSVGDKNLTKLIKPDKTGIIVSTPFGPHRTTFSLLDDIINYGEQNVSAIKFSNSVHNAAASYISQLFNITGPTLTITKFKNPVEEAMTLASCWLNMDFCENILLCFVDERGSIFDLASKNKLNIENDYQLRYYSSTDSIRPAPSEGAVCFLLKNNKSSNESPYCKIENIKTDTNIPKNKTILSLVNEDGIPQDSPKYIKLDFEKDNICFSPIYGSTLIGPAFNCALAASILANSDIKNRLIGNVSKYDTIRSINCLNLNCKYKISSINLNMVN